MIIYVDADAIPAIAKELLIKTANRTQTHTIFVANSFVKLPPSPYLASVVVASGFDVADEHIVSHVQANDLVVTSDIPLADSVIDKGAKVLTARGEELTAQNIKQRLNSRDFMDMMRGTGVLDPSQMGGQKSYGDKDKKRFADALNQLVQHPPTKSPLSTRTLPYILTTTLKLKR